MDTELIRELGLDREMDDAATSARKLIRKDDATADKIAGASVTEPQVVVDEEGARPSEGFPFRSTIVTLGPSMLLDAILAGGVVGVAVDAFTHPAPTPARRALRTALALGSLAAWGYVAAYRPWHRAWGATERELRSTQPGDGIIPRPTSETTRAITIDTPAAYIWPWLLQLGQGRGGFYSYDWIENLAGLDIHSVDEILPQYQRLMPGDEVPFGNGVVVPVLRVEQERALVIGASIDLATGRPFDPSKETAVRFVSMTWAFVLHPIHDSATRLIARFRIEQRPRGVVASTYPLFIELPHFVMERRMLRGIRTRAERLYAASRMDPR